MSLRQYAATRKERRLPGGTHGAVRKAIASGRLSKSVRVDGKGRPLIDSKVADSEWSTKTDPTQARAPRQAAGPQQPGLFGTEEPRATDVAGDDAIVGRIRRSQADRLHFKALTEALNYYNSAGELAAVEDVDRETARLITATVKQLRAVPERICGHLAACNDPHRIKMLLTGAYDEALLELLERERKAVVA